MERPSDAPRRIPRWAWQLNKWLLTRPRLRGPRPPLPLPVPSWFWRWRIWYRNRHVGLTGARGVDYAWGIPSYQQLQQAGYRFAIRYVSHDPSKDLAADELQQLWAHGLHVGLVFETAAGRALDGYIAGVADARLAKERSRHLGLQAVVYFAVDFDATDADKPKIARYLEGAASILGTQRVGVYGDYYVCRYLDQQGTVKWFWQTYAWSGGLLYKLKTLLRGSVHPAVHIYQRRNGVRLAGLSVDEDKALRPDIGVQPPPSPAIRRNQ